MSFAKIIFRYKRNQTHFLHRIELEKEEKVGINLPDCQEVIYSNDYADYIVNYSSPSGRMLLKDAVCQTVINEQYAVVHVKREAGETNDVRQFLRYQNLPRAFGLLDTAYLEASGVSKVQRLPGLSLFGQGVIIGIIDTGIDYRHPAFLNADGTTRIGVIWDQTIPAEELDSEVNYGSVYRRETINQALAAEDPLLVVPSIDENGHGTFLAGIAGGGQVEEADFSGVAHLCELAVVKLKEAKQYLRDILLLPEDVTAFQETDIFTGIHFLTRYATSQGKPFVILLGSGTNTGNHGKSDYLKNYLNNLSAVSGRAIVLPAGNEGNLGHHYRGRANEIEAYQDVELHVGEGERGFFFELWATVPDTYSIGFISPRGEYIEKIPLSVAGGGTEVRFVLEQTRILVFYEPVDPFGGSMLIWVRMKDPTPGNWRLRIFRENLLIGRYDIWLPMERFIQEDTLFLNPDPNTTICEPGNAEYPMTVTAYNDRDRTLFFGASRGFTRTNGIKPDFAAPGVEITGPYKNQGYRTMTGTSVSAAVAAGCAALLLDYNNYYSGLQISNLLIKGTNRKSIPYPNQEWGFGEMNLYNSLESLRNTFL